MRWISLSAVVYVLVGLGFYSFGFGLLKKRDEFSSRFGRGMLTGRSAAAASLFEEPHSRWIVIFFKGLGIFLVLAGVTFFLLMR